MSTLGFFRACSVITIPCCSCIVLLQVKEDQSRYEEDLEAAKRAVAGHKKAGLLAEKKLKKLQADKDAKVKRLH